MTLSYKMVGAYGSLLMAVSRLSVAIADGCPTNEFITFSEGIEIAAAALVKEAKEQDEYMKDKWKRGKELPFPPPDRVFTEDDALREVEAPPEPTTWRDQDGRVWSQEAPKEEV